MPAQHRPSPARGFTLLVFLLLTWLVVPVGVSAQDVPTAEPEFHPSGEDTGPVLSDAAASSVGQHEGLGAAPAGDEAKPATRRRTRVYVGMWTAHVRELSRGMDQNSLLGLAYRGYYGGTFINSFGDRSLAAGVQRSVPPSRLSGLDLALGYRAGLLTGYDGRFAAAAEKSPVLPFLQLIANADRGSVGAEVAWAGLVASFLVNWRF